MEVEAWIKKMKELYTPILSFLESENDSEDEFQTLTDVIDNQEIVKNEQSIKEIFQLLYSIGDNHHRNSGFFDRLLRIIKYLTKERLPINDTEIFHIYKKNKRLLLLLFEHKIITPNESILNYLKNNLQLKYYLFSEIKNFVDEEMKKSIEKMITEKFNEDIEIFERKCKEGENDSHVCKLIRQDLIEEFVSYVSQTNLSLTSKIKADYYESNPFLIENESSLIEYAFFYGSIQVIKYLQNNHVKFSPLKIWLYAIHSNNPEMIEFLENYKIKIDKENVKESIKCHHNEITDYIISNLIDQSQYEKISDYFNLSVTEFCNYYYYPEDIISIISNQGKSKFQMRYLISSLSNITIPSSVTSIGDNSFFGCSSLIQISIPSSVTSIGNYAFCECSSLTQISIPNSVTSIGSYVFKGCSSLKQISIPNSVISIGENAFFKCKSLIQISFEIPSSVTSIGYAAFRECSSLKQISIPNSVTSIGSETFRECSSLTQISIPSSITSIEEGSFDRCSSLAQITIPSSVTSIGNNAFSQCSSLTQITIPSSVTSIGSYAFSECTGFTKILIPSSVFSIGSYAFSKCSELTEVSVPSSVIAIGYNAFFGCSKLKNV